MAPGHPATASIARSGDEPGAPRSRCRVLRHLLDRHSASSTRPWSRSAGGKLNAESGDAPLTLAGDALDVDGGVAVRVNVVLIFGNAHRTPGPDGDAFPRQEVHGVRVPVLGASISDLVGQQKRGQLSVRIGLRIYIRR